MNALLKHTIFDAEKDICIYLHWPFCQYKCPYCDFNSYNVQYQESIWVDAFLKEIDFLSHHIYKKNVRSIFFGGGTPSLMSGESIDKILKKIFSYSDNKHIPEITIECNPESLSNDKLIAFKKAGINRISLGVQSFNNDILKALGRPQYGNTILKTIAEVTEHFENSSLDIIYGVPNQSLECFKSDITKAFSTKISHISLYQLTVERNTPFYKMGVQEIEEDDYLEFHKYIDSVMPVKGFQQYEVSNYARDHNIAIHNMLIWHGAPYLGIGPGAHGRVYSQKCWYGTYQTKSPNKFLINNQNAVSNNEIYNLIDPKERSEEYLMCAIRTSQGVDLSLVQVNLPEMKELENDGLITIKGNKLLATNRGFSVLNYIIGKLLA